MLDRVTVPGEVDAGAVPDPDRVWKARLGRESKDEVGMKGRTDRDVASDLGVMSVLPVGAPVTVLVDEFLERPLSFGPNDVGDACRTTVSSESIDDLLRSDSPVASDSSELSVAIEDVEAVLASEDVLAEVEVEAIDEEDARDDELLVVLSDGRE